jgi:hypothetical protein
MREATGAAHADDVTKLDPRDAVSVAAGVLTRQLFELDFERGELASALQRHDVDAAKLAARGLAAAWRSAIAAMGSVETRATEVRNLEQRARGVLHIASRTVGELLARSLEQTIREAELHGIVKRLERELDLRGNLPRDGSGGAPSCVERSRGAAPADALTCAVGVEE